MMENERGRIDLLIQEQIYWCNEHCNFVWFVKDDGKVYSKNERVCFKNKKAIVSFPIRFGDCENFTCSSCDSLRSLEGSPERISGNFNCSDCDSLQSLEGSSENVSENFHCSYSDSLKSLKGAPKSVGGSFYCHDCMSLESIEGVSKSVGEDFDCSSCYLLKSLEGSPEFVGGYFMCSWCRSLKSIDGLKNTQINSKIFCNKCPKLEKYEFILSDMNVFKRWQKSEYTADEFLKEYDGFLQSQKYGI